MKKLLIGFLSIVTVAFAFSAFAQAVVTLKSKPVMVEKQGDVYVAPSSSDYYTYTDNGTDYVCTAKPVSEITGVTPTSVSVRVTGTTSKVTCYPSSYFSY